MLGLVGNKLGTGLSLVSHIKIPKVKIKLRLLLEYHLYFRRVASLRSITVKGMTRTKWVKVKSKIHLPFRKLKSFHREIERSRTVSLI